LVHSIVSAALLVCGLAGAMLRADDAAGLLRVELRERSAVTDRLVTVGDVADISGGTADLRSQASALDLLELSTDHALEEVAAARVTARLLIAGFAPDEFQVEGAELAQVTWQDAQSAEERVLAAIRRGVEERLYVPAAEVAPQLAQPLPAALTQLIDRTPDARVEARFAAVPTGGRTRVDVWVTTPGDETNVTGVTVDIRFRQIVPVVAESIAARQVITADSVSFTEREVSQLGNVLPAEQVVGMAARRNLAPGEVIVSRDLTEPKAADAPVLIKARDLVRLTARKGNLVLTVPAAEALQTGREGDFIRVRNPSSGKIVLGRVVAAGEVEVPL
jgi:flagella basal body P-ring formation protein FlgA